MIDTTVPDSRRAKVVLDDDLGPLSREELEALDAAGARVLDGYRRLAGSGIHLLEPLLALGPAFQEHVTYPRGAVRDPESGAAYYYHAHDQGEHGHFHAYMLGPGIPAGLRPVAHPASLAPEDTCAHLVSVSVDEFGVPIRLFTINRWASDESWYRSPDARVLLSRFRLGRPNLDLPTNGWLEGVLALFRPQVERLLDARDEVVRGRGPIAEVLEDRSLEVISEMAISVDRQLEAVRRALARYDGGPWCTASSSRSSSSTSA